MTSPSINANFIEGRDYLAGTPIRTVTIDGVKTLPLNIMTAVTTTEIPFLGEGMVRLELRDPEYDHKDYKLSNDWIDLVFKDVAFARKLATTWPMHISDYMYYSQFKTDRSRAKITSLHNHTALISLLCDARLGIDTATLWKSFNVCMLHDIIQSKYRDDPLRSDNYETHADKLRKLYESWENDFHLSNRVISRILSQIQLNASSWAVLPPVNSLFDTSPLIVRKLNWVSLKPSDFERLLFSLVSTTEGYENAEWLTSTNAPDDGRDLSVYRRTYDLLSGDHRYRVIIACKHWTSRSVDLKEISILKDQMLLWKDPRVNTLILASSGTFTTQAIRYVEQFNQEDHALFIELWSGTHLERLLAERPALVQEFGLLAESA